MTDDAIAPDSKDWTWVLERPCLECGFDAATMDPADVGSMIRANGSQWPRLLEAAADVRIRPRSDKWSPLEYAAHVRDVYRLYLFRLNLMLDEDGPHYPNWDQDETAVAEQYDTQDPDTVLQELVDAANALADRFDGVTGDNWWRTGYRSDGAEFTVDSFARYLIHDPIHHVWDVTSG